MADDPPQDDPKGSKKPKTPDKPVEDPISQTLNLEYNESDDSDNVSVPKEEFAQMQSQMVELQEKADKADKDKAESERKHAYETLLALNPKLAKINEKSSTLVIKTVIETAKEIKSDFPSFVPEDGKEPTPPPREGVVGYKDPETGKWVTEDLSYQ